MENRQTKSGHFYFGLKFALLLSAITLSGGAWSKPAIAQTLGRVPIQVTRVPQARAGTFFVKASVPLPEHAGITGTKNLAIVDEGARLLFAHTGAPMLAEASRKNLPAQFTVLSRWNGTVEEANQPIKWLLAEFPLDFAVNSTDQIVLTMREADAAVAGLELTETAAEISVTTGKLTAVISKKRGTVFESLRRGNTVLLAPSTNNTFVLQEATTGDYYTSLAAPHTITIEARGPQVATILVRGTFKNSTGTFLASGNDSTKYPRLHQPFPYFSYTVRYHFYADQDYLKLDFTLENNGVYGYPTDLKFAGKQWLYFNSLLLNLPFTLANGAKQIGSEGFNQKFNGEACELLQEHSAANLREAQNFSYRISKNGVVLKTGERTTGWLDVHDGANGVVAAVQHFWQNAPKKMFWQGNRLRVHLWPEEGKWPSNVAATGHEPENAKPESYQFEGGRHKTHTLLLRFYEGPQDLNASATLAETLNRPLFGLPPSDWTAITGAWPMFAPTGLQFDAEEMNEALARYERTQRARAYVEDADRQDLVAPATLYTIMEGETDFDNVAGRGRHYGWMNFGDLYWAEGHCSNHYDWPYVLLLHFLRTGKDKLLDLGEVMARHRYDLDHYWGKRRDDRSEHVWAIGLSRYEKGYHGDLTRSPHAENQPRATHTWIGGLLMHYLLSGDRQALSAAQEVVEGIAARTERLGLPRTYELRYQGWSLLNCLLYYNVTGERRYYDLALRLGKEDLLALESARGKRGYWGDKDDAELQSMVMFTYVIEPLLMLHHFSRDAEILQLLERMANWLRAECLVGGVMTSDTTYWPLETPYDWKKGETAPGRAVRNLFYANLYGYLYWKKGGAEDLSLARQFFRDSMFWFQAPDDARVAPASRTKITMLPVNYAGTHTKVHGWSGRAHQIYLHSEWQKPTAVADDPRAASQPRDFYLAQSYPNPFVAQHAGAALTIPFGLARGAQVKIEIVNILGQRLATLVDKFIAPGHYQINWDGKDASGYPVVSGSYWIKMSAPSFVESKKVQVLR